MFDSIYFGEFYGSIYWAPDDSVQSLAGWGQDSKYNEEDDLYCLTQAILIVMRQKL